MHRREGLAKLTGRERYVDDLPLGDFLWGATVRSPAPRRRMTTARFDKGVAERALAKARLVMDGTYETGAQEHICLEPQGMIAHVDGDVVVVRGSMQCPYYVVKALTHALHRDEHQVRVVQAPTGGGFGGKEEYPSTIALHAALLALKSGRTVKLLYDRAEDMAATTKRHPARVRHRTGVTKDGKLVAQDIDVLMDGGAYVTLSPVVLSRGIIHAAGPYPLQHVRIDGRAMCPNPVPFGGFRGFGAPQTLFPVERHMDGTAHRLGIDPAELRRRNLLRDGEQTATGQVVNDGTDRVAVLERALALADYDKKRAANKAGGTTRRGIGIATFHHGAGFTGSGEVILSSRVDVAGLPDGRIEVLSANIQMGQGAITVFTALAAARLGLAPDDVVVAEADTARVPNSGPTVASRTSMVVGRLVERACDDLRRRANTGGRGDGEGVKRAIMDWHRAHPGGRLVGSATYERPPGIAWDDHTYTGDA